MVLVCIFTVPEEISSSSPLDLIRDVDARARRLRRGEARRRRKRWRLEVVARHSTATTVTATTTLDQLEKRQRRRGGATCGGSRRRRSTATTVTATASHPTSTPFATFSPISPAPVRVGEDEPPLLGILYLHLKLWLEVELVVANGSPKLRRLLAAAANASKKTYSPKCGGRKRSAGSYSGGGVVLAKQRADWDVDQEKSLVEILHEYKDSCYRSDNGWNTEGWNQMVKKFHERNKHVCYTRNQIQEKEGQLKRDYRMLKAARAQSGASWNSSRNMVEGPPHMWDNLVISHPKIKKIRNNKARFPLYDALGEVYDGHLAEGTYNILSFEPPQEKELLQQIHDVEDDMEEPLQQIHDVEDDTDKPLQKSYDVEAEGIGRESAPAPAPPAPTPS